MELKQKRVSVLQGDGSCISRILARESSVGESSRIFYRSAQGVPFRWEMQPGTPKNPQEDEVIPTICPSPLMQSLGLPLPNLDRDETPLKTSKIKRLVKERINDHIPGRRSKSSKDSVSPGSRIRRHYVGGFLSRRDVFVFARTKWKSFTS